jgi:hypothetical protein
MVETENKPVGESFVNNETNTSIIGNKSPGRGNRLKVVISFELMRSIALARYGSWAEFARAMGGYSQDWGYHILRKERPLKEPKTIKKVADALGIDYYDLRAFYKEVNERIKNNSSN